MIKFLKGFRFAINGIRVALREQLNLKVQVVIAVVVVTLGVHFQITLIEWIALLLTIALVFGLELINTAIENLVDLVTTERKPLAGKIKDIAAGAVLIVSVLSVIIGWLIFKPYLFPR